MKSINLIFDNKPVYVVGDIHGVFNSLLSMILKYAISNSIIIVAGDCGIGFKPIDETKDELKKLSKLCKSNGIHILMIRGNHDNPDYFNNEFIVPNIYLLKDYTTINGTILCIGGATSIDRKIRMDRYKLKMIEYRCYHPNEPNSEMENKIIRGYWENELPIYDEEALNSIKEQGFNIKHIVTHTCPSKCQPLTKDGIKKWIEMDSNLENDLDNERNVMDMILNKLHNDGHNIETWTYGHFHHHNIEELDGIKYTMLDAIIYPNDRPDWIELKF